MDGADKSTVFCLLLARYHLPFPSLPGTQGHSLATINFFTSHKEWFCLVASGGHRLTLMSSLCASYSLSLRSLALLQSPASYLFLVSNTFQSSLLFFLQLHRTLLQTLASRSTLQTQQASLLQPFTQYRRWNGCPQFQILATTSWLNATQRAHHAVGHHTSSAVPCSCLTHSLTETTTSHCLSSCFPITIIYI